MRSYSLHDAQRDMLAVEQNCGYSDPTAAVAFARIVKQLTQNMSEDDFSSQPQLMAFVFEGLFSLRDWVFNTGYRPSAKEACETYCRFEPCLRLRLRQCNGQDSYVYPQDVDGQRLWHFFYDEFLPVAEAVRSCGDATTDLSFLRQGESD